MQRTLNKSLLLIPTLVIAICGTARQPSANQDATPPNRIKVEGQVMALKVKYRVNPSYTPEIRKKGIERTVELHVFVATDGTVQRLEVVNGDPLLAKAAVEAVKQWIFEPVTVDGKPVEVDTTVEVSCQILDRVMGQGPANQVATPPNRTKVEGQVMAQRLRHPVVPVYPAKAKAEHIEGNVKLRAIIATDGSVQHLEVEEGEPILVKSALKAVKQWTYEPFILNGKSVEVDITILVNFQLAK